MEFRSNGVKYKPPRRKRHKLRSIQGLLPHCKRILLELLAGKNNINGVFRKLQQTGFSYKRDVLDAIGYLEKARLVCESETSGNTKVIMLTDIGRTAANLIVNVQNCIRSWKNLDEAIVKRFDYPYIREVKYEDSTVAIYDHETLPGVLRNRGWSVDEINQFLDDECRPPLGMFHILEESPKVVINVLLYRYLSLLELELNETVMAIIQKIMIGLITDVVSFIQIPTFPKEITELDHISDLAANEAMSHTVSVMEGDGFAYSFMNKKMFDALRSIFVIANPRKEYLKKELHDYIQFANLSKVPSEKKPKTSDFDRDYSDEIKSRIIPFLEEMIKASD